MFTNLQKTAEISLSEKELREKNIKEHNHRQIITGKLPIDDVLTTEKFHPETSYLSLLAQQCLPLAIETLTTVDKQALAMLLKYSDNIKHLQEEITDTLKNKNKIIVTGCGAAGRAAYQAIKSCFVAFPSGNYENLILPLIAGGEASLVRAGEGFEDNGAHGIKQLIATGWNPDDLVIALSASGSAEFIHEQLNHVATFGFRKPFFLYCNSNEEVEKAFSNKKIFCDPEVRSKINFLSINVGPMAVAGSTRMQAATAQILAVGIPLLDSIASIESGLTVQSSWTLVINSLLQQIQQTDFSQIIPFIEQEANAYSQGKRLYYHVNSDIAQVVLTDTTERSPTFNLEYFENDLDSANTKAKSSSLCRIIINDATSTEESWRLMLGRDPVALEWENSPHTQLNRILGYDLSETICIKRLEYLQNIQYRNFYLEFQENKLILNLQQAKATIDFSEFGKLPPHLKNLTEQVFIKLILNIHSTLVMGKLGLYYGNLMVYVRPSNFKLINRGIRLVYESLEQVGSKEYQIIPFLINAFTNNIDLKQLLLAKITTILYDKMRQLLVGESIVLETLRDVTDNYLSPLSQRYSENYLRNSLHKNLELTNQYNRKTKKDFIKNKLNLVLQGFFSQREQPEIQQQEAFTSTLTSQSISRMEL